MSLARILVIDDDAVVTRMLSRVLSGHDVIVTESAEDALELLKSQQFDLILCDLAMPGMSGMAFYEAVRALSAKILEKIVFMTGGAFTTEGHEFLSQLPHSAWLEKPFDIGALREMIRVRAASAEGKANGRAQ